MKKILSKFKIKLWRVKLDILKILPYFVIVLSFLPILPHKKKMGELLIGIIY
tara:strand:- start:768 stop:923 length:156 start_codon:yes stop_codon:yes gene_type:complete